MNLNAANSELASPVWVREPRPLDKLTMRPKADRFNSGNIVWVTTNVPTKLGSKVFRTASRLAAPGDPSPEVVIRVVDQDIQPSLLRLDIGYRPRYCVPLG